MTATKLATCHRTDAELDAMKPSVAANPSAPSSVAKVRVLSATPLRISVTRIG